MFLSRWDEPVRVMTSHGRNPTTARSRSSQAFPHPRARPRTTNLGAVTLSRASSSKVVHWRSLRSRIDHPFPEAPACGGELVPLNLAALAVAVHRKQVLGHLVLLKFMFGRLPAVIFLTNGIRLKGHPAQNSREKSPDAIGTTSVRRWPSAPLRRRSFGGMPLTRRFVTYQGPSPVTLLGRG